MKEKLCVSCTIYPVYQQILSYPQQVMITLVLYYTKVIWACNERKKGLLDHKNEIS